jgi:hypothetical protein
MITPPRLGISSFRIVVTAIILLSAPPAAGEPGDSYSPSRHCPVGNLECLAALETFSSGDEALLSEVSRACVRCHIGCGECHPSNRSGTIARGAGGQGGTDACLRCHAGWGGFPDREPAAIRGYTHLATGMTCRTCHESMEVGSATGSACASRRASCESCHAATLAGANHRAYGHDGRLACLACHAAGLKASSVMDITRFARGGKATPATMDGECVFLVNSGGKVGPANLRCFHDGQETLILLFYPMSSHDIKPAGRACHDCHGSPAADDLRAGSIRIVRERPANGGTTRIIPVARGIEYLVESGSSGESGAASSRVIALTTVNGTPLDAGQLDLFLAPWR